MVGETNRAIVSAQKAIHSYPNVADGWAVLSSALFKSNNPKWSNHLIQNLTEVVEISNPSKILTNWVHTQYLLLRS